MSALPGTTDDTVAKARGLFVTLLYQAELERLSKSTSKDKQADLPSLSSGFHMFILDHERVKDCRSEMDHLWPYLIAWATGIKLHTPEVNDILLKKCRTPEQLCQFAALTLEEALSSTIPRSLESFLALTVLSHIMALCMLKRGNHVQCQANDRHWGAVLGERKQSILQLLQQEVLSPNLQRALAARSNTQRPLPSFPVQPHNTSASTLLCPPAHYPGRTQSEGHVRPSSGNFESQDDVVSAPDVNAQGAYVMNKQPVPVHSPMGPGETPYTQREDGRQQDLYGLALPNGGNISSQFSHAQFLSVPLNVPPQLGGATSMIPPQMGINGLQASSDPTFNWEQLLKQTQVFRVILAFMNQFGELLRTLPLPQITGQACQNLGWGRNAINDMMDLTKSFKPARRDKNWTRESAAIVATACTLVDYDRFEGVEMLRHFIIQVAQAMLSTQSPAYETFENMVTKRIKDWNKSLQFPVLSAAEQAAKGSRRSRVFACGSCPSTFPRKFNLERHERDKHGKTKSQTNASSGNQPEFDEVLMGAGGTSRYSETDTFPRTHEGASVETTELEDFHSFEGSFGW